MEKNKQIELRSEKVRNIIGQVPPILLRYGISIIGLSLLMTVVISAFIPYQPDMDVEVTVEQYPSGELVYKVFIPQKAMERKSEFDHVITNSSSEIPLPKYMKIISICDTVFITPHSVWYIAKLAPEEHLPLKVRLEKSVSIQAKICLRKISVLEWITKSLYNKL